MNGRFGTRESPPLAIAISHRHAASLSSSRFLAWNLSSKSHLHSSGGSTTSVTIRSAMRQPGVRTAAGIHPFCSTRHEVHGTRTRRCQDTAQLDSYATRTGRPPKSPENQQTRKEKGAVCERSGSATRAESAENSKREDWAAHHVCGWPKTRRSTLHFSKLDSRG